MKTFLVLAVVLVLCGCYKPASDDIRTGGYYKYNIDTVRNHEILTTQTNGGGSVSSIHSPSCPCFDTTKATP